jgi:DNA adenine methylase
MFDDLPSSDLPKPRPVVSWAGGKQRLLKHLLPLIKPHTCYVEVFGGSGALMWAKQPSHTEVFNDINGELVSLMRCLKFHRDALLDELDLVLNSRREFEDYGAQPGLTQIQRAARWLVRNKLSFAGHGHHFAICRSHPLQSRVQRQLALQSLNRRLDRTIIEERDWAYILKTYDHEETLFFLDPPYPEPGGAIYDGWNELALERFCTAVKKLRGRWIFTFKDCDQVRAAMAGYTFKSINRARGIANNHGAKTAARYVEIVITSDRAPVRESRKGRTA